MKAFMSNFLREELYKNVLLQIQQVSTNFEAFVTYASFC